VRLWLPEGSPRGWVLFSVGFGGERSGYAYLGRFWASLGLATAVVEHVGSNLDILKALPGKTRAERNRQVLERVADPHELQARPRDLLLAHARLQGRFGGLPLGLAGHSYGSYTVLAALGLPTVPRLQPLPGPLAGARSCLIISPQPPGTLFSPRALGMVDLPILLMTGTRDGPLSGEGDYRDRRAVFDHLPKGLRNLAVLPGVEHMAFAGIGLRLGEQLRRIEGLTGRWWESTLWDDRPPFARARDLAALDEQGEYR
jgi:predicted dienelactone hydrolase